MSRSKHSSDDSERLRRIFVAKRDSDVDYLVQALRDPDHRQLAARFLGDVGDGTAGEPLMTLLNARDAGVRAAAARSLGRIQVDAALPRLVEMAQTDSPFVRSWAIDAVTRLGGVEQLPFLIGCLDDPEFVVRRSAAVSLGELGDQGAVDALRHARDRERWRDRKAYRQALRRLA